MEGTIASTLSPGGPFLLAKWVLKPLPEVWFYNPFEIMVEVESKAPPRFQEQD